MSDGPSIVYIEAEIEYVRKATVLFSVDPHNGIAQVGAPMTVGRVMRALQYWMHTGKSLIRGETPKLLGWRIQPEHDQQCEAIDTEAVRTRTDRLCQCAARLQQRSEESITALKVARHE